MEHLIPGIHHVTALAGDPQQNVDFYVGLLGLRMVKRTVNFDDPETYHLYYGDEAGSPGSIMTFFPWPNAPRGRIGRGQATATAFSVRRQSLGFWLDRLTRRGVATNGLERRFSDEVISFSDSDGLALELVAPSEPDPRPPWRAGPVPAEHAVRGIHGVTLSVANIEPTVSLLTETLGFRAAGEAGNRFRFATGNSKLGSIVDLLRTPETPKGVESVGTVHHIAWRASSDAEQEWWRSRVADEGYDVTPIVDRRYFRSIYFREPGGVLFEIATDAPGFAVDESLDQLGARLLLPPWLEPRRAVLERSLPPISLPRSAADAPQSARRGLTA